MAHPDATTTSATKPAKAGRPRPKILTKTIWTLDLNELAFDKMSHKKLMDPTVHLKKERIIWYQLAMLICLAAECCATYSLSKYEDLQTHIEQNFAPAHLYNNNLIDFEIVVIVMCVMVACLYGADFFFLAQFPRQTYAGWYQKTKLASAVTIVCGVLAGAVGLTYMVARESARIVHVSQEVADQATALYFRPPLQYNKWAVNIAACVLVWIGWACVVVATYYMFKAVAYDKKYGTGPPNTVSGYPSTSSDALATPNVPRDSESTLPTQQHLGALGGGKDKPVVHNDGQGLQGVELSHGEFDRHGQQYGGAAADRRV